MLDLKIGQYEQVLLDYEQIIRAHESSVGILQKENDRLFKSWSEENKKRHEAENRPYLSSSLGWTTAGVMTIVSGVLTVILIAQ
jgi:cytoskeletal protein RodZ